MTSFVTTFLSVPSESTYLYKKAKRFLVQSGRPVYTPQFNHTHTSSTEIEDGVYVSVIRGTAAAIRLRRKCDLAGEFVLWHFIDLRLGRLSVSYMIPYGLHAWLVSFSAFGCLLHRWEGPLDCHERKGGGSLCVFLGYGLLDMSRRQRTILRNTIASDGDQRATFEVQVLSSQHEWNDYSSNHTTCLLRYTTEPVFNDHPCLLTICHYCRQCLPTRPAPACQTN